MKRITAQAHLGQRGVNFLERRILDMGCLWHPTGQLEAGIDGFLEIRKAESGELPGVLVAVQSKATGGAFQAETKEDFDFHCSAADLDYWLSSSWPIILVCSRPERDEAYWISLKDQFRDPARRKSRKAHFDKAKNVFNRDALPALLALGAAPDAGLYLSPPPKPEQLVTNLLPIEQFPETFMVAETGLRHPREVWEALRSQGIGRPAQWILTNRRIFSFHDLRQPPWADLCDQGTADTFMVREWAESEDPDQHRQLVWLLNETLRDILAELGVRYERRLDFLYFRATPDLAARTVRYFAQRKRTSRVVFQGYPSLKDPKQIAFYRHSAVNTKFRRFDGRWFLQLSPTYHFTSDGAHEHPFREEYLSGIKRLEHNAALLGQVVMWSDLLVRRSTGLFPTPIRFGPIVTLPAPVGVPDWLWLGTDEEEEDPRPKVNPDEPWLFDREMDE